MTHGRAAEGRTNGRRGGVVKNGGRRQAQRRRAGEWECREEVRRRKTTDFGRERRSSRGCRKTRKAQRDLKKNRGEMFYLKTKAGNNRELCSLPVPVLHPAVRLSVSLSLCGLGVRCPLGTALVLNQHYGTRGVERSEPFPPSPHAACSAWFPPLTSGSCAPPRLAFQPHTCQLPFTSAMKPKS